MYIFEKDYRKYGDIHHVWIYMPAFHWN